MKNSRGGKRSEGETIGMDLGDKLGRYAVVSAGGAGSRSAVGLDHTRLTYLYQSRDMRLTDVHGEHEFTKRLLG